MNKSLISILITVFLDMLGIGIVIPIAAPLILNEQYHFFEATTDFGTRALILGFLLSAFPIAQFFGAPVLGTLADKYGRKKILTLSLVGTLIGFLLFAMGIWTENLALLFASRLLDGFTGGNVSIAMAAIADISEEKDKARNFGIVGASFGLGFILGPYIGGKLADNTIISWFSFATPYLFSALLSLLNLIIIQLFFQETLAKRQENKVNWRVGFQNVQKAFTTPNLRVIFTVTFFLTLGFTFFTHFLQVFMIKKFQYSSSNIADFFAYIGIWIFVAQGFLLRPLTKYLSPRQMIGIFGLGFAIATLFILLPNKANYLYYILPVLSVCQGLTSPNATAIVSQQADSSQQGEILGINQSMQSLGNVIPPIVAGFLSRYSVNLPILSAAFFIFLAWLIFVIFFKPQQENGLEEKIEEIGKA